MGQFQRCSHLVCPYIPSLAKRNVPIWTSDKEIYANQQRSNQHANLSLTHPIGLINFLNTCYLEMHFNIMYVVLVHNVSKH